MVSVIVPIYKVEAYLEKCIKSIQNQTHRDLEIILVDDGSPDGCGDICDAYAKEDARIKVIHKENGGLSDARNKGLDIAGGDYILFVDSDDFIHPRMVEILLKNLQEADADMAVCGFKQVEETDEVAFPDFISEVSTTDKSEIEDTENAEIFEGQAIMNNLQYKNLLTVVAWNKLYKRELFRELRYPRGHIHEDEFLTHRLLHLCKRTVYINTELYYYRQRSGSIMGEVNYSGVRDGWAAYEDRLAFLEKYGYEHMALHTKEQMLHYIFKYYPKLESNCETAEFLIGWHAYFKKLYYSEEVQTLITEELRQEYKSFVIAPKVYYNKMKKQVACKKSLKQMVKRIFKK